MQSDPALPLWWELPAVAMVYLGRATREDGLQAKTLSCKLMKVTRSVLITPFLRLSSIHSLSVRHHPSLESSGMQMALTATRRENKWTFRT